jgi:multiple antibiotic resistance protein
MLLEILYSAFMLFIIIDPFLSLSMFISLTNGHERRHIRSQAALAVFVAGAMILLFLLTGTGILDIMGVDFSSFKIGGGVILLLLGIKTVMGSGFSDPYKYKPSIVIIGTPMLSGPGALTTLIVVSGQYGFAVAAFAGIIVLGITYLLLINAYHIQRFLTYRVIEILSRIMGLLLTALAVQFIVEGIKAVI